jgi:tetratricopeptide (TPR) repeat protein
MVIMIKKEIFTHTLITIFLFLSSFNFAQNKTNLYATKHASEFKQIKGLLKFAFKIEKSYKYDSLEFYSSKALNLSNKIGAIKEKMESSFLLGRSYYYQDKTNEAIDALNQTIHLSKKLNFHSYYAKAMYFKALAYQKSVDYENAFTYFFKAYDFCIKKILENDFDEKLRYYTKLISRNLAYNFVYSSNNKKGTEWFLNKINNLPPNLPKDIERMYYSDISYIYSQGLDHTNGQKYAQKALEISKKSKFDEDKFQDYAYFGIAYGRTDIEKSTKYNLEALNYVSETDEKKAWVYNDLSWNYTHMGELKKAIDCQYKSIEIHELNKDSIGLTFGFISLGIKMLNWRNYADAEHYLYAAANFFKRKKLSLKLSEVTLHICKLHLETKKFDKAEEDLKILETNKNNLNIPRATGLYHLSYGDYALKTNKNYEKALQHLSTAIKIFRTTGDKQNLTYCYSLMGEILFFQKKYSKSKHYLKEALNLIGQYTQIYVKELCLKFLIKIYEFENDKDNAFLCMKQLSSLQSIIFERETKVAVFKKEKEYKIELNKSGVKSLHSKNKLLHNKAKEYRKLFILSLTIALFIILSIYAIKTKKHKKLEKNTFEIKANLEKKVKEVKSYSQKLKEREETIAELKKQFAIKANVKKSEEHEIIKLNNNLQKGIVTEEGWEKFLDSFSVIYPKFIKNLNNKYPNLSNNDIKILVLLKLNINSKDTAQMLMISSSSLMTARYRLRKKLNMKKHEKLQDMID